MPHHRSSVSHPSLRLASILSVLLGLFGAAWTPSPVQAQTDCVSGCVGVRVTPDGGTLTVLNSSSGNVASFEAQNTGQLSATYTFTCSATGNATCGPVTPASATISEGSLRTVNVSYSAGAPGSGRITLSATGGGSDTGFYTIAIVQAGPPVVAFRNHNRDNVDRSLCLTAGAGEAAAWSCGDLVITHGLPGYATLGRERTLTLIHNSATAYPRPPVAASVTVPAGVYQPSTVFAELKVGGTVRTSASYAGWPSGSSGTRQIVLDFNGASDPTGAYPIELRVQNQYPGAVYETVIKDTLLIVNRFFDEFGAGFSLAGLEQLYFNQPVGTGLPHLLWVGGDGSAKLYRQLTATTWVAPLGGFRDTIALSGGVYTRTLRHGVKVKFNSAGRHISTVNRAGQQTTFTWNAAGDRLLRITVPPTGVTGNTDTLAWDANNNLDYIADPTGRKVDATFAANDGRLTMLTDPDGNSVMLGWDGDRRIISRRTRRGFTTTYEYSSGRAVGSRISKVTVPVGRITGDNTTAVTTFDSWNDKGLAGVAGQVAIDVNKAYTTIYGPRYPGVADTAAFTVDRWGAPTKVVNALGATTTLLRGDVAVPALVTRVTSPDLRVDSMLYNGRGNLLELHTITSGVSGSTPLPTATTRWTYNSANTKDSPDSIIDPEGVVTRYAYDTLGLTSQVTESNGHVTQYVTVPSGSFKGLVQSIKELSVPSWDSTLRKEVTVATLRTGFAFNTLGNAVGDTSPMGRVRRYPRDAKQRVSDLYDAAGHRTEFKYDSLNRTVRTIRHVEQDGNSGFPRDPDFTTALVDSTFYNVDVMARVADPRGVVRSYGYDAANRPITETDDSAHVTTRWYNKGGLLDSVLSRGNLVVRHTYDAAGQQKKLLWPAVANGTQGDSVAYTYDITGRLTQAQISWPGAASVTRTYYGTGAVRTDVENSASPTILVSQAYYYDRAGRRTGYRVGTPGDAVHSDSVAYTYDATSGELRKLKVWWRTVRFGAIPADSVRFRWDALGRRDTVAYSSGAVFAFGYEQDGMQRLLCSTHGSNTPATVDMFQSRVVHDWVDQDGMIRKTNGITATPTGCGSINRLSSLNPGNTYDNRHELKSQAQGATTATYKYDGSGNTIQTTKNSGTPVTYTDSMASGHNQLVKRSQTSSNTIWQFRYAPDGSRFDENPCQITCTGPEIGYRQYLYDGLDRTVGFNQSSCGGGSCQIVPNSNCYYDPMGRFLAPCENGAPNLGYDGENVVRTGSDGTNGFDWTFIHGPGTDNPVLGHYPGTVNRRAFFLTDGNGRQYVVADQNGTDLTPDLDYTQRGGKYAGGTQNASSFGADRQASSAVPGVSFFRNRVYDQATGRWTQEDPIGLAGGLNLYQFNQNNPVMYTDPFGLRTCPPDCGAIHTVGAVGGAIIGGIVGATGGAVAGTAVAPVAGTLGGGLAGGTEGAALGAAGGLAAANVAEAVVDVGTQAMGKISRAIGQIGLVIGGLLNPGGQISPSDHTATGAGAPVTEAPTKGKKERKDEQEGGGPAAGE
ncbi:MAG: RHS repeat-associated core domain-containing protein [Gemmatimonadales bacterium]